MNNIEEFSTEELRIDYADTLNDIEICLYAIDIGIYTYTDKCGNSCDVKQRLEGNLKIKEIIEKELSKRSL